MVGSTDPVLDHWWSPADLAVRWKVDRKTARVRLDALNALAGGRLYPAEGPVRVLGRILDREFPSALGGDGASVREVRQVVASLRELEAWRDGIMRQLDAMTRELQALRGT